MYIHRNFNFQIILLFPTWFLKCLVQLLKDILYRRVGKSCHCSGTSIIIQNSTLLLKILTHQGLRYVIMLNMNLSTTSISQTNIRKIITKAKPYISLLNTYIFHPVWLQVAPKPNTFTPFGNGVHSCPGNELAKLNMFILIHHLVTKIVIKLILKPWYQSRRLMLRKTYAH